MLMLKDQLCIYSQTCSLESLKTSRVNHRQNIFHRLLSGLFNMFKCVPISKCPSTTQSLTTARNIYWRHLPFGAMSLKRCCEKIVQQTSSYSPDWYSRFLFGAFWVASLDVRGCVLWTLPLPCWCLFFFVWHGRLKSFMFVL
jgi:hypothetical protein